MDHYGFLSLVRDVQTSLVNITEERKRRLPEWRWNYAVLVMPESICPFCKGIVKSPGLWFLSSPPRYNILIGMIPIDPGKPAYMNYPNHPHLMTSGGYGTLCLGTHHTGMSLLASAPNLLDCPMGPRNLPQWYERYWNHKCPSAKAVLDRMEEKANEQRQREREQAR